jgi:hypothetical protein
MAKASASGGEEVSERYVALTERAAVEECLAANLAQTFEWMSQMLHRMARTFHRMPQTFHRMRPTCHRMQQTSRRMSQT